MSLPTRLAQAVFFKSRHTLLDFQVGNREAQMTSPLYCAHHISRGSWLTASLAVDYWLTIRDLVYGNGGNLTGWLLDLNLATPGDLDLFNSGNQAFYGSVIYGVLAKATKGMCVALRFELLTTLRKKQRHEHC
jgi:hypothetical protein